MPNTKQNVTDAEMMAYLRTKLDALEKENERLRARKTRDVQCEIGSKGGLVIKGLNNSRFPVTLYLDQWERLVQNLDTIQEFVESNRDAFATKR